MLVFNKLIISIAFLLFVGVNRNYAQVIVMTEDFESSLPSGLPAGWSSLSTTPGTGDFYTGDNTDANLSGWWPVSPHTQFAMANDDVCNCDMSEVYLISPVIDLTGVVGALLTYEYVDNGGWQGSGGMPHTVESSPDGGLTWELIYTFDMNDASIEWQSNTIGLGSSTDNNSNVQFRFKFDDNGDWMEGLAIDDVIVKENVPNNAAVLSVSNERFGLINTNESVFIEIQNLGANTINTLSIDLFDGVSNTEVFPVSLIPGQVITLQHGHQLSSSNVEEIAYSVTIMEVNTITDSDPTDNNGNGYFSTISQAPIKQPVIEEGTGTPCGWCPRGTVAMDYMSDNYADFLGIAVHCYFGMDPMSIEVYETESNFDGYPGMHVDRDLLNLSITNSTIENQYLTRQQKLVPATLTGYTSGTGGNITINVDAKFYTAISSEGYQIGVILTEDSLSGTTSDWSQANSYAGGANGIMGGFENLPSSVPANQMVYDHVGRALIGGYGGQSGSVPGPIVENYVASYVFNYTVPANFEKDNMHAIAVLIDTTTGVIVNAGSISMNSVGIAEEDVSGITIYPNPTDDYVTIEFDTPSEEYSITITDISGRIVLSEAFSGVTNNKSITLSVSDLEAGRYLLSYSVGGVSYSENITIK